MRTPREEILFRFGRTQENNPNLKPAQFMMMSRPGVYKNEASASRAYRKFRSGESSGAVAYKQSFYVKHYPKLKYLGSRYYQRDGQGNIIRGEVLEPRRGGFEHGLFKANITFKAIDEDGSERILERSFTIESYEYDSSFDIPIVYDLAQDAVQEHVDEWASSDRYDFTNVEIISVEILKIERSMLKRSQRVEIG